METLRANEDMSPQAQTTRVDGLAKAVSERLIALDDQHRQNLAQLESFQHLLRQQGNSILAHTVDRVKEVLERNVTVARQHLSALIHRQSP
jgi:DNA-binding FadR family transcriptional regulator